jgi:HK97 gp10 family phage protein
MSVDVQINESLWKKLDSKKLSEAVRKSVQETTRELKDECVEYSPKVTGNLRRGFSYEVTGGEAVTRAKITNNTAPYWVFLEYGTRYIPEMGNIQRAVEVTEPGAKITARFKQYYKPGGK